MDCSDVWTANMEIVLNLVERFISSIQKSQQALQGDAISEQVANDRRNLILLARTFSSWLLESLYTRITPY